jgi:iron complex outermembrane receptor protein
VTAFYTDFKNKQATAFDPDSGKSFYRNIGREKHSGLEIELGNTPINGWAFYGSLGFLKAELKDNLRQLHRDPADRRQGRTERAAPQSRPVG